MIKKDGLEEIVVILGTLSGDTFGIDVNGDLRVH